MPFAKSFLNKSERALVEEAIKTAETMTSAEIVVHLEDWCWGDPLKVSQKRFAKLGMHKTEERNGVLIYIATLNHKIAVMGDEGIYSRLGKDHWDTTVQHLISEFKANHKAEALAACVLDFGKRLGEYFPRKADDKDELSNKISY